MSLGSIGRFFKRLYASKSTFLAFIIVALYIAAAIGFEVYDLMLAQKNIVPAYAAEHPEAVFSPPSAKFLLGTDYLGRDCFLRAVGGISTAVKVGVTASVIAVLIGVTAGLLAGYYSGKTDSFIMWLYSTFSAMPSLLFILAFALLFTKDYLSEELTVPLKVCAEALNTEPGMLAVYLAIGLTGWTGLCRVARAETLKLKNHTFVQAAKVSGASDRVIIFKHILPNIMHLVIIYFTLRFAYAVMTEVLVSYLGLGVQSAPSWGVMISDGQERLWRGVWWEVAAASGFMFILVLSLNLLGDGLRDILDPKSRNRG